uniref:DUF6818 domain-containing protein n=1 Tax=Helicotheca tamesis TaxID=374047 RepID=A0A7S2IDG0_9STRA
MTSCENKEITGGNYHKTEIEHLLRVVTMEHPIGNKGWKRVTERHNEHYPQQMQDSIRRIFDKLRNKKPKTSQSESPPHIKDACKIFELIKRETMSHTEESSSKASLGVFLFLIN